MRAALARHDALMRAALEAHGGYIFKTIGDEFCAAFPTASNAAAAALDAQRAILSEDFSRVDGLHVRIALHTGAADERSGDYFGPAVNRVARLLAIGHGGQVLVSGVSADLLQGEMPPQSSLRDLGAHRLKDLARSEQVYQLIAADLPEDFAPLRSLDELPNNLPPQLTSFVGREHEVADIKALIEQHRLVTLVGAGGAGKTRCAIQVGAELLDGSGDGVWLAELARISDQSLVASVLAQALNVRESPDRPVLDTLLGYLKRKRLLIVLDNCEHVIEGVVPVAGAILQRCPDVCMLATSREPLNISGEATYRMPSLEVPENAALLFAEGVSRYGAVQLFMDRAVLSNNHFTFTKENAPHIAEICRRLDGIPLAIELAAARVKVLSPQQLVKKLDERFRVLTRGDRTAVPRQQTMRALIDWSYELLSNDERALFRKLAIFAGSFTLRTAVAVYGDGEMDEIVVLDLLSSLVDKSLVQAEAAEGEARYRLLESTRQYAREKLAELGEENATAYLHALAFVALAEQFADDWEATPDRAWFSRVAPEMENIRAALSWAFGAQGEALLGQRLSGALRPVWWCLSPAEGRRWIRLAQERIGDDTPDSVRAAVDLGESWLAGALKQYKESLAAGRRALARYSEIADPLRVAEAQLRVGKALALFGDVGEGEALLLEALNSARALGARRLVSIALEDVAMAHQFAGDVTGARQLYGEALANARAIGDDSEAAVIAINLAEAEFRGGDAIAALRLVREAHSILHAFNERGAADAFCNEAAYLVALHRYDEARVPADEAVACARDGQMWATLAFALQHVAAILALRPSLDQQFIEDRRRAARLVGYVKSRLAVLKVLREYTEQEEYDAMLPALRDAIGAEELSRLMSEGETWDEDRAVAEAGAAPFSSVR